MFFFFTTIFLIALPYTAIGPCVNGQCPTRYKCYNSQCVPVSNNYEYFNYYIYSKILSSFFIILIKNDERVKKKRTEGEETLKNLQTYSH
uniref:EB domain-containing protein n=1 Tax=Wuchereria bancrofti TaxID=6293 RepID=A0AAF5PIW9_WUCBA